MDNKHDFPEKVFKITLKDGHIWFDDCSKSLEEAKSDAEATFKEMLLSVVEC